MICGPVVLFTEGGKKQNARKKDKSKENETSLSKIMAWEKQQQQQRLFRGCIGRSIGADLTVELLL